MMEVSSQPSDECLLVSLSLMDILGLLGAESKSPIIIRDEKKERSTGRGTSRRGRSNVENEINVRIASSKA